MYLEYSRSPLGNFGDDLNPWLWPQLLGDILGVDDGVALVGIGTLLDQKRVARTLKRADRVVVFSAGAGFSKAPKITDQWRVYCVRGPFTAEKMGLSPDLAVADGAYLLRTVALPPPQRDRIPIAFIPHHNSEDYVDWEAVCAPYGITSVSMRQPVEQVLRQLQACELVVTEAMHGAIVSDALRVPWHAVQFSPKFMPEKWRDFTRGMDINLNIHSLPTCYQRSLPAGKLVENGAKRALNRLGIGPAKWGRLPFSWKSAGNAELQRLGEAIAQVGRYEAPHLSSESKVQQVTAILEERLARLEADYRAGRLGTATARPRLYAPCVSPERPASRSGAARLRG